MAGILAALFVIALFKVPVDASAGEGYRLPSYIKPVNYRLTLEPDLDTNVVRGSIIATIMVSQSVDSIVLNAADLKIVGTPSLSGHRAFNVTYNYAAQTAIVGFNSTIQPGIWELWLEFLGRINTAALAGVFRISSPALARSVAENYVLTHFEPTDARKAFPCWDEPALKATFDVSIVAPVTQLVLSNTPVVSRRPLPTRPHMVVVQFARTPLMSTYLLAFIIGKFDHLETVDSNGVLIRVYTPVGRRNEGAFSLAVANKTLPYFKKLFGSSYPLPKMDLVSVPVFPSIAMENWGLVLAHEPSLLVSTDTPRSARAFTAVTVMHELAHQWFGNLVTPRWWSDLWLNEGFATWVSFFATSQVIPELNIWDDFVPMEKLESMQFDAMEASHPIEAEIKRPQDVAEMFDSISYGKGAAVLNMLYDWLGHERFFAGLQRYLARFRYANAATGDLWLAMQEATGEPVLDAMRDWTARKGFPVIKAAVEWDAELETCVLELQQLQYRLPGGEAAQRDNRLWRVPLTVATESGDTIRRVMTESRMSLALPTCGWAMLNPNGAGYYRIKYGGSLLRDLMLEAAASDAGRISRGGRLTLVDDAFAMHTADMAWAEVPLRAVDYLRRDPSLQVWSNMLNHLYSLGKAIQADNGRANTNWLKYLDRLCSEKLDEFGWVAHPKDPPDVGGWRSLLVTCLDYARVPKAAQWARAMFPSWVNNTRPASASAELWASVCEIVSANGGGPEEFQQLLEALRLSTSVERRQAIIGCLGSYSGAGDGGIDEQLELLALGNKMQSTEVLTLIGGMSTRMVWRLLTRHWEELVERFQGPYMLKRVIDRLDFRSAEGARQIRSFFSRHSAIGVRAAVHRKIEEVLRRVERTSKDRVEMQYLVNTVLATGDWSSL